MCVFRFALDAIEKPECFYQTFHCSSRRNCFVQTLNSSGLEMLDMSVLNLSIPVGNRLLLMYPIVCFCLQIA